MSTSSIPAGWAFGHGRPIARHMERVARAAGRHRGRHGHPHGPFGPRGPAFFGPPFFGGGRRAARGDIRAAILALLLEQPMHGYQVIQELERRTDGAWRPSPGSVYPTLQQLEDEGLVRSVPADGGRRAFELTDAGRSAAGEAAGTAPWEDVARSVDEDEVSLRDLVVQVAAATWQVAQSGTRRQATAAQDILRDARRRLYRLLAEDAPSDPGTGDE